MHRASFSASLLVGMATFTSHIPSKYGLEPTNSVSADNILFDIIQDQPDKMYKIDHDDIRYLTDALDIAHFHGRVSSMYDTPHI
jgi:hypothetical protein